MKFFNCTIFIVLFLAIVSCSYNKELKAIDQNTEELKAIDFKVNAFDVNSIKGKADSLTNLFEKVKEEYVSDTIDKKLSIAMNDLKVTRRFFKKAGSKLNSLKNDIIAERESLLQLKNDVQEKAGDSKKYNEYIRFEKEKIKQIGRLSVELLKEMQLNLEIFQTNTKFVTKTVFK